MTRFALALSLAAIACGTSTGAQRADHGSTEGEAGRAQEPLPPTPSACVDAVARAKRLGRALYEQDLVTWWATDAAKAEHLLPSPGLRGWVSTQDQGRWSVHFLADEGGRTVEPFRVVFANRARNSGSITRHAPAIEPDDEVASRFRARQAAAQVPFEQCSDRYVSIVLPASDIGEPGWLVYFLATTPRNDEWVVGGHVRRLVSEDGTRVLKSDRMSKDCLTMDGNAAVAALAVVNLLFPCPTEIHVWLSLRHREPLYVANETGIWKVRGDEITYLGSKRKSH